MRIDNEVIHTIVTESLCGEDLSEMYKVWVKYLLPQFDV